MVMVSPAAPTTRLLRQAKGHSAFGAVTSALRALQAGAGPAMVVDDQAMCLDWAEETGARVVQACLKVGAEEPEFPVSFTNYEELPALVETMCGQNRRI